MNLEMSLEGVESYQVRIQEHDQMLQAILDVRGPELRCYRKR